MTERPGDRRVPYYRWEQFCAYENGDGTAHVLVFDDSGGRLFADGFDSIEEAQWTCGLLNAAIGNKPQPPPDEFSGIKVVDFRKE
jgi:hypothetical protein